MRIRAAIHSREAICAILDARFCDAGAADLSRETEAESDEVDPDLHPEDA